jgi:hypothetical protein
MVTRGGSGGARRSRRDRLHGKIAQDLRDGTEGASRVQRRTQPNHAPSA